MRIAVHVRQAYVVYGFPISKKFSQQILLVLAIVVAGALAWACYLQEMYEQQQKKGQLGMKK